jgi:hypothetical protein
MKALISEEEYQRALDKGCAAMLDPYAIGARFSARSHSLSIEYSNGMTVSLDVRKSPLLTAHPDADLSEPYVTPGGDGLIFDKADLSFGIPSLVAPFLPESLARQKISSIMGRVRSSKKAESSKANGARGGRPRKVLETA